MILGTKHFRKETSRNQKSWLVGGWPTPLKNMSSSVGMIFHSQYIIWKVINSCSTNQKLSINHPISIAFHSYVSLPAGNHHVGWGPDDHLMVVPQETHHFLVLMGQSPTAAAPRCAQGASAASPWPGAPGASASWPPRCRWRRGRSAVFGVSHGGSRGAFIGAGNPEFMMNYLLVLNAGNEGMIHNH